MLFPASTNNNVIIKKNCWPFRRLFVLLHQCIGRYLWTSSVFYCLTAICALLIFGVIFYWLFLNWDHCDGRLQRHRPLYYGPRQPYFQGDHENLPLPHHLPFCPDYPEELKGHLPVTFESPSFDEITRSNPLVKPGGRFGPDDCIAPGGRIAIIIPYRSREKQLRALLHRLHPILQRQKLNYAIIVVEQAGNGTFNKALLMNAGYLEVTKHLDLSEQPFQCFIFHDVDLHVEDDRAIYGCANVPVHLSEYIDKFYYEPFCWVDVLYGGIVSIKPHLFEAVNGYSNLFFGWGGEDYEMRQRLGFFKIPILIPANRHIYRFKMFPHEADVGNARNGYTGQLLAKTADRMFHDGLNTLRYSRVELTYLPTHTRLLVKF